ncbi:hypothetical protein FQA39_LY01935 [Lamprigera yunnana]|nr:hypothetical protein FQA39_LY01935 [Lamprigera yunnana]
MLSIRRAFPWLLRFSSAFFVEPPMFPVAIPIDSAYGNEYITLEPNQDKRNNSSFQAEWILTGYPTIIGANFKGSGIKGGIQDGDDQYMIQFQKVTKDALKFPPLQDRLWIGGHVRKHLDLLGYLQQRKQFLQPDPFQTEQKSKLLKSEVHGDQATGTPQH